MHAHSRRRDQPSSEKYAAPLLLLAAAAGLVGCAAALATLLSELTVAGRIAAPETWQCAARALGAGAGALAALYVCLCGAVKSYVTRTC